MSEKGVSLIKTFIPILVNVPAFILFSATLRRMAEKTIFLPEMAPLGLFGTCLSLADPFLTAGTIVLNAIALEIGRRTLPSNTSPGFVKGIGIVGHFLNIVSFWILSNVPSVNTSPLILLGNLSIYLFFKHLHPNRKFGVENKVDTKENP